MLIDFAKLKIKGTTVKSLVLRELIGDDSDAAAARVVASDMKQVHGFLLSRAHTEQCIADAITHVNGDPIITPYLAWTKWNLRTREFVIAAYNRMNSTTEAELNDFFKQLGLVDADVEPSASPQ